MPHKCGAKRFQCVIFYSAFRLWSFQPLAPLPSAASLPTAHSVQCAKMLVHNAQHKKSGRGTYALLAGLYIL